PKKRPDCGSALLRRTSSALEWFVKLIPLSEKRTAYFGGAWVSFETRESKEKKFGNSFGLTCPTQACEESIVEKGNPLRYSRIGAYFTFHGRSNVPQLRKRCGRSAEPRAN